MNRLILIDGNAILHRAYHALPPFTAPDGSVVNAVYGFASMLLRIFNDLKPTHMAVAFDRPEKTFRKKMFQAYQAQRPEMEDTLVSQIDKVKDLVRAFGLPIYEAAGFEADDVIGSIAEQIKNSKLKIKNGKIEEVIIITGDKDILQLVDDGKGIKVFMPTKGLSEGKLFGESETKERMGVTPDQIADLKALMGDSSDNYSGVAGIGPKTAVDLLTRFRTLEAIYQVVNSKGTSEKLPDSVKDRLKASKDNAFLSQQLATIRCDAPVEVDFDKMRVATLDTAGSREKLEEFNFQSLIKRLTGEIRQKKEKAEKPAKKKKKEEELSENKQLALV